MVTHTCSIEEKKGKRKRKKFELFLKNHTTENPLFFI